MIDYQGVKCPVCEKPFAKDDDIVVCPICGAPYHRSCYKEKGECVFTELHEKGESWKAPKDDVKKASPYEIKDQECGNCGTLNAHSALFCNNCGNSLKIEPQQHINNNVNKQYQAPMYGVGGVPVPFDPMGGVSPMDSVEDGISYGEVSKVVQQNTMYYLPVFKRLRETKKCKFNFTAFIFSGAWLLFRKQYKSGIIVTVTMFALYLAQTFTSMYVSLPVIAQVLDRIGISLDLKTGLNFEQMQQMAEVITPMEFFLISIPSFTMFAMFIIMLVTGLRGNKMYLKHCIKTINKTRSSVVNSQDYNVRINEVGGVNTSVLIVVFVCYTLCSYLPAYFI